MNTIRRNNNNRKINLLFYLTRKKSKRVKKAPEKKPANRLTRKHKGRTMDGGGAGGESLAILRSLERFKLAPFLQG
jgi:hypothetical protein